jgi:hypothetical protein
MQNDKSVILYNGLMAIFTRFRLLRSPHWYRAFAWGLGFMPIVDANATAYVHVGGPSQAFTVLTVAVARFKPPGLNMFHVPRPVQGTALDVPIGQQREKLKDCD